MSASAMPLAFAGADIPVAVAAGFLSFLAPCVLPLVPGYLSAVSAVEADRLGGAGSALRVVRASMPFVLGFTLVFVALGAGAAAVGDSILRNQFLLEQVAGFVLIVFGLVFMGLLPWPERLLGAGLVRGARSRGSRVMLGGAFAVCAAPCIGPVLGSILVLAGNSTTVLHGSVLLFAYSAGLAVPFILAGALFTRAMGFFRWLRDHYFAIQVASGTNRRARRAPVRRQVLRAAHLSQPRARDGWARRLTMPAGLVLLMRDRRFTP